MSLDLKCIKASFHQIPRGRIDSRCVRVAQALKWQFLCSWQLLQQQHDRVLYTLVYARGNYEKAGYSYMNDVVYQYNIESSKGVMNNYDYVKQHDCAWYCRIASYTRSVLNPVWSILVRCRSMIGPSFYGTPGPIILGWLDPPRSSHPRFRGPLPGRMDPHSNRGSHTTTGHDLLPNVEPTKY